MKAIGRWIAGGLGFVLGGPIGAVIGFILGSAFDGINIITSSDQYDDPNNYQHQKKNKNYQRPRPTPADIRISIIVLISCVMKADGHVKKSELEVVKAFLRQNYSEPEAKEALHMLKELLQQNIDHIKVAEQIRINVNYSTRLEILHFLLELAHADGDYSSQEQYMIEQITRALGLTQADYRSILAPYGKQRDPNWAFQALEIESTATDEEVKKAYRRMAMKYHPDKVSSAGEEVKQKATEKFRAINEAYEHIKTLRGIK